MCEDSYVDWTAICLKRKEERRKQKAKPHFIIKTGNIFLSICTSAYKCTACGCVRKLCNRKKYYQHLKIIDEISFE